MPICMMDDKDGTGDGEWGKQICVMGTPWLGGGWVGIVTDAEADGAGAVDNGAGSDGMTGGAVKRSEITGTEAVGRAGRPP
jgi:hypothetical protein